MEGTEVISSQYLKLPYNVVMPICPTVLNGGQYVVITSVVVKVIPGRAVVSVLPPTCRRGLYLSHQLFSISIESYLDQLLRHKLQRTM